MKPDNIFISWTCDKDGNKTVTDAALSDFDIAFKSEAGESLQTPYAIGNAMWRSPEGLTGRGVTKASDIFSFGLVVGKPCLNLRIHANLLSTVHLCSWGLVVPSNKRLPGASKEWYQAEQEILI